MVKSDLKINYWELRHLLNKIRQIQPAIDNFQKASANFRQAISEQEGKSIDELVKFYDENLDVRQKELQERLSIIEEILVGYINGMIGYIAPVDELKTMRVDRYDIRINLNEIYSVVHQSSLVDVYIPDSCDEYWRYYDYNPDLSEEENAANANEVYAENCAEQRRRQDNYNRIRNFNRSAALSYQINLDNCCKVIEKIYEESIVPYEQKDDTYFQKLSGYYNQWATMRNHLHDLGEVQNSALRGGIDAIKDFGQGIAAIGHPKEMVEGLKAFAADPSNAIGQMFQDFMDRTDENGFFYGTTYIAADVGIGYVTDKGAHKALEALKGLKGLKYADEVADLAEGVVVEDSANVARATEQISSLRDLMSPEEIARYDAHWLDVAEQVSDEALDNQISFIKNGGITKPGGGAYKPAKVCATVDLNTGDIYFGYNGTNKFNPSKMELHPELQKAVTNTQNLAANTVGNKYAGRMSFEKWSVDNCAEVYSVNQALYEGADMNNILINTKYFTDGSWAPPCRNCKETFAQSVFYRGE